mgnify:CR=1 FL=1
MFNFFKKSQKEIEQQKALQDMANFAMQQMTATQAMQQHKMFMAGSAGAKAGSGIAGSAGSIGGAGGFAGTTYVTPGHISAGYSPNNLVMIGVPCEDCGHRNDFPVDQKEIYCYLCNAKISVNDVTNSDGRPLYNAVHKNNLI